MKLIADKLKCARVSEIYSTNLVASLLANGITSMLVGKATIKPITQPLRNLGKNPSVHPVFIVVIVKVIVVSRAKVIKNATNKPEYFLFNFKSFNRSQLFFQINILNFLCVGESD